eukprot:TRINITY_DN8336_c0_g1_i1.p1 TRINITY_DN8336_c0_g1~~TRINITY_DN8336_c0_g1_i1.p1  ORF type:complete len:1422 (+),score=300.69 TRINITY_DN8336_c0_g1_i1:332-4267(+)
MKKQPSIPPSTKSISSDKEATAPSLPEKQEITEPKPPAKMPKPAIRRADSHTKLSQKVSPSSNNNLTPESPNLVRDDTPLPSSRTIGAQNIPAISHDSDTSTVAVVTSHRKFYRENSVKATSGSSPTRSPLKRTYTNPSSHSNISHNSSASNASNGSSSAEDLASSVDSETSLGVPNNSRPNFGRRKSTSLGPRASFGPITASPAASSNVTGANATATPSNTSAASSNVTEVKTTAPSNSSAAPSTANASLSNESANTTSPKMDTPTSPKMDNPTSPKMDAVPSNTNPPSSPLSVSSNANNESTVSPKGTRPLPFKTVPAKPVSPSSNAGAPPSLVSTPSRGVIGNNSYDGYEEPPKDLLSESRDEPLKKKSARGLGDSHSFSDSEMSFSEALSPLSSPTTFKAERVSKKPLPPPSLPKLDSVSENPSRLSKLYSVAPHLPFRMSKKGSSASLVVEKPLEEVSVEETVIFEILQTFSESLPGFQELWSTCETQDSLRKAMLEILKSNFGTPNLENSECSDYESVGSDNVQKRGSAGRISSAIKKKTGGSSPRGIKSSGGETKKSSASIPRRKSSALMKRKSLPRSSVLPVGTPGTSGSASSASSGTSTPSTDRLNSVSPRPQSFIMTSQSTPALSHTPVIHPVTPLHSESEVHGIKKGFLKKKKKPSETLTGMEIMEYGLAIPARALGETTTKFVQHVKQLLLDADSLTEKFLDISDYLGYGCTEQAVNITADFLKEREESKNTFEGYLTLIKQTLCDIADTYREEKWLVPDNGFTSSLLTRTCEEIMNKTAESYYLLPSYLVGGRQLLFVRSQVLQAIYFKAKRVLYASDIINHFLQHFSANSQEALIYFCGTANTLVEEMSMLEGHYRTLYRIESFFWESKIQPKDQNRFHGINFVFPHYIPSLRVEETVSSVEGVLVQLCSPQVPTDTRTRDIFTKSYFRIISDSEKLFRMMIALFNDPNSNNMVKNNVVELIYQWMAANPQECDKAILDLVKQFMIQNVSNIDHSWRMKFSELLKELNLHTPFKLHPSIVLSELDEKTAVRDSQLWRLITLCEPRFMAEKLTFIDREIYNFISAHELLDQAWSKEKQKVVSQNAITYMERANNLSYWVASLLLMQMSLKERTKVLCKIISLAQQLWALNNYHSMMGVLAGINLSCITRLKQTFAALPPGFRNVLQEMLEIVCPLSSFRNLRAKIEECSGMTLLPFMGLHMSDLTFAEEGNKDFILDDNTQQNLVNWPKHMLIWNTIESCLKHQGEETNFTGGFLYPILLALPKLSDDELYALSLEREPRSSFVSSSLPATNTTAEAT